MNFPTPFNPRSHSFRCINFKRLWKSYYHHSHFIALHTSCGGDDGGSSSCPVSAELPLLLKFISSGFWNLIPSVPRLCCSGARRGRSVVQWISFVRMDEIYSTLFALPLFGQFILIHGADWGSVHLWYFEPGPGEAWIKRKASLFVVLVAPPIGFNI